ncbi:MAG: peptidoglycan-binding protein [Raineya sp.]|jgi:hypothetical protein|nr:peptidoglycan-binding protein [Raineya sp.]
MKMDKKKMIVGAVLGVALIAVLIWVFFFRKSADGSTTYQKVTGKKPNESDPLKKDIKTNISSGLGVNTGQVQQMNVSNSNINPFPLKKGSRGELVKKLQQALTIAGYDTKGADGAWGSNTDTAFQAAFPGSLGISDLKDLENKISELSNKTGYLNFGFLSGAINTIKK